MSPSVSKDLGILGLTCSFYLVSIYSSQLPLRSSGWSPIEVTWAKIMAAAQDIEARRQEFMDDLKAKLPDDALSTIPQLQVSLQGILNSTALLKSEIFHKIDEHHPYFVCVMVLPFPR